MNAFLLSFLASLLIFFYPVHEAQATVNDKNTQDLDFNELNLPAALADDDSFDDLPFEQLRQALREEVERGPRNNFKPHSFKQYNFLIR